MFLPDSSEYLCPVCKEGNLIFRDYCLRTVRYEGGESEKIRIPRHQCNNPGCRKLHRMLPDILVPYKHYSEDVIRDAVSDKLDLSMIDDLPSMVTIKRWKRWVKLNHSNIDGQLKSICHRELDFPVELLMSGVPLLKKLMCSIPGKWLRFILRILYNSGACVIPVYS